MPESRGRSEAAQYVFCYVTKVSDAVAPIRGHLDEMSARGLAAAVTQAIREGGLAPGDHLPPIRSIARELALSPTTVSVAWSLLARAGSIRTAGRRGTVVTDVHAYREGRYRQALQHQTPFVIDLSTGVPDGRLLPGLGRALGALRTAGTPASYLDDPVLPELATLLVDSWPYPPPALTVVDGAMDALELVIRSTLRYGDRVIVEHPTFPPLIDLLDTVGAQIIGVGLDDEGMVPEQLEAALDGSTRAVFVQPRGHNPTGVSMTPRRTRRLAQVLTGTDVIVIEDDAASAISTSPDVSIGKHLPEQTVHIRSYSKSHGPDLRLAALSGPTEVISKIQHVRQLGQGWSSRLLQRVLAHLLTDEASCREVELARDEYAQRRAQFVAALARRGVRVGGTDGLNIWVPVHDEAAATMRLAARGIGVAPGTPFTVLPGHSPHIRVTVGLLADQIEDIANEVADAAHTTGWGNRAR